MADNAPKVGQIITDGDRRRDAIHVAVLPVKAGRYLTPGMRVGVVGKDPIVAFTSLEPIGVVDQFLQDGVKEGEWFWLFLFPGTVTSLRHYWTHPVLK